MLNLEMWVRIQTRYPIKIIVVAIRDEDLPACRQVSYSKLGSMEGIFNYFKPRFFLRML